MPYVSLSRHNVLHFLLRVKTFCDTFSLEIEIAAKRMVKPHQTPEETKNSQGAQSLRWSGNLRPLLIAGALAVLILFLVSVFWPNLSERTKFFTANLLNLVIALAVLAQVVIYRKQWHVMERQWQALKEQTQITRDSFYVGERAYIYIQKIRMREVQGSINLDVRLLNAGETPAWGVHCTADIALERRGHAPAPHVQKPSFLKSEGAFIPAREICDMIISTDFFLSGTEARAVEAGNMNLFAVGVTSYKTIGGVTQIEPFCARWSPAHGRFEYSERDDSRENPN